ncbi:MAG TPA: lipid A deacylase LpxR family protein [Geobacteraceae bacterium]
MIALLCISAAPSSAAELRAEPVRNALSIRFENDAFGGTDSNYTDGISLALTRTGKGPLAWVWDLGGKAEGERFATYELTQLQFTPSDIERSDPDPTDRPYAGLLYLGLATHLQRDESLHSLKLMAGVAGPASYAEGLQRFTHHVFGYNVPHGWSAQLKNEPVVNLLYEYRHKYRLTPRDAAVGIELIPMGGAFLGNYLTQAEVEVQCRIGYHPDDFGATVLRGAGYLPFPQEEGTRHAWGFYAFAGGAANLVGRNLTLDGNTFTQSRSVDKRLFLPAAEFGASLWTRHFQTTFSYVMWGKEFYGQTEREDYGSVLLSFFF